MDTDADGRADQIAELDADGGLAKLAADTDADGKLDTFQYYESGAVAVLETDTDADGHIDERNVFEGGRRVRRESLTVEGAVQSVQEFDKNDLLVAWRRDSTGDGKLDTVCRYGDAGLESMAMDTSGNGVLDTVQIFRGGLLTQQRQDTNGDGVMDMTTELVNGEPASAAEDTDGDGRADVWRKYENGVHVSTEEDRDHDGAVDARHDYGGDGRITCSRLDDDGDGCFEVRIRFREGNWGRVVELSDKNGRLLESRAYSKSVLRQRRMMDAATGLPVLLETYDEDGRILMAREAGEVPGRFDMTWYYDEHGAVARAESDRDADGNVDIWYHYQAGVAVRIEEDRDRDGKPDLWEDYADDERLLSRREDLDFDGTADIEETF